MDIIASPDVHYCTKYAVFDLDHTLIKPKSGNIHPKNQYDWMWWSPEVPDVIRSLSSSQHHILIISNQSSKKKDETKAKVFDLLNTLNIPSITFHLCYSDEYRKPCIRALNGYKINKMTFYCGDALGRKGDYSNSDALFAFNLRLVIKTPEEVFLNAAESCNIMQPMLINRPIELKMMHKEHQVILMCGFPASGKSTLAEKLNQQHGYVIISQDKHKTLTAVKKHYLFNLGKERIIVDNTFPDIKSRSWFIEQAKRFNANIACIYCKTPINIAYHLNHYRCEHADLKFIPKIAYYVYRKKHESPSTSEGFDEIYDYIPYIDPTIFRNFRYSLI